MLCAIAFLAWLWRVRDNARTLSGHRPRYAWPWVYAGWIVPTANLWIPRGIVADIHRASAPGERLPHAVNWWWGLWLVSSLGAVGLYAGTTDAVIARAYAYAPLLLVVDAAAVATAVAGVFVVRALDTDEGGRGLYMVAQFTQLWGTRYHARGKTIWAEQALPNGTPATTP